MTHLTIEPSILYVGTPVALLSTVNDDGTSNLAPMSSAWALGDVVVLGVGGSGQTAHNLQLRPELVINYPSPAQWEAVERIAGLTGRHPVPDAKKARFRFEREKFKAAGLTRWRPSGSGRRALPSVHCSSRPPRSRSNSMPEAPS